jgi:MarR family transcriptional regulator, organic hydroperoxide resistance regulator
LKNHSEAERFEDSYKRVWGALNRSDDPDLSQHERQLLHHIPSAGGVTLGWLANHLALPKSSASVLVKDLARRGFVRRSRDTVDERRLSIVLTPKGRRRVDRDRVLEPAQLQKALDDLPVTVRRGLLSGIERLADSAEDVTGYVDATS